MNLSVFQGVPSTSPTLNKMLTALLNGLTQPNPNDAIRAATSLVTLADFVSVYPATTTATAYAIISFSGGTLILIAGAETAGVAEQLIPGPLGGISVESASGANNVFAGAANTLLASIPGIYAIAGKPLFIAGHSFGGGTAQVLAWKVQSGELASSVRCWSYGAPRCGVRAFARQMYSIDNSRFMTLADVVPHLPPNSDDDLSIAAILSVGQLRLANSWVQPPYGYTVDATTGIVPASNNSARLDFLGFNIFSSVFYVQFGNDNSSHTLYAYNAAFTALAPLYVPPTRPPVPNPEFPITQTVREREQVIAQAEAVVRADATAPNGITRSYVVPPVQTPAAPRYHSKRVGKLWTIQLSGVIVGIATGKRQAHSVARKWNRAARATLIV